jgi:uncharacterized delta-60 repeat protein
MWFRSTLWSKKASARSRYFRPQVHALEDRCLLSAGALDPTFGAGAGYVTTSLSSSNDTGSRVLLQPGGTILVAGNTSVVSGSNTNPGFGVVAYNPDGSLNTAFGSGGIARLLFQGTSKTPGSGTLWDAALEPTAATGDDKIVLAGNDGAQVGLALMRLNANGSPDTTFGNNGQVVTLVNQQDAGRPGPGEDAHAVAVTGSGQIMAVGQNGIGNWYIARYNANGSLDTSFGSGGKVSTTFTAPGIGFNAIVRAAAPQPDGKLVVVGYETWIVPVGSTQFRTAQGVVVRYNANGSLDTTFGNGGFVYTTVATGTPSSGTITTDFGMTIYPTAGTADDGKIVVVGRAGLASPGSNNAYYENYQPLIERYNPDGSLDTTFGSGAGYVTLGSLMSTNYNALAVTVQSDGKLIVANRGDMITRLNRDGSLDAGFGNGGTVTTDLGSSSRQQNTSFAGVAIQPNGDIVAAGQAYNGSKWNFAVARYLPSQPQIGSFTASPSPVTSGTATTLTASNISDGNAGAAVTQVTFYYYDGTGTKQVLGYGTSDGLGDWALSYTVGLAPGSYTLYAQALDSDGAFGDPLALTLQVM